MPLKENDIKELLNYYHTLYAETKKDIYYNTIVALNELLKLRQETKDIDAYLSYAADMAGMDE